MTLLDGQQLAIAVFVTNAWADDATRDEVIGQSAKVIDEAAVGLRANDSGR